MARPIVNPITYGTLSGNVPMSNLDTSFNALFTTGFNDSSLGWINYAADTGIANAYAVTLSVTPSSYTAGMCVTFTPQNSNTGASTINVNSLGTQTITNRAGIALSGGEITLNSIVTVQYDGTKFRIITYCGLSIAQTNPGATSNINCAGYDSVSVSITTNVAVALQLQKIGFGVPVWAEINNSTGGNIAGNNFSITDPTNSTTNCVVTYGAAVPTGNGKTFTQNGATLTVFTVALNSTVKFTGVTRQTGTSGGVTLST